MDTTPYELILELSRADKAGDPYAFKMEPQVYNRRLADKTVKDAQLSWDAAFVAAIEALRAPKRDPEIVPRLGNDLRAFLERIGWSLEEARLIEAVDQKVPVVITIRSAAAELYTLPWELLALGQTMRHVGELPNVTVRYEWPGTTTRAELPSPRPEGGRILLAYSHAGGKVLANDHLSAIQEACDEAGHGFDVDRDVLPGASRRSLGEALAAAREQGEPIAVLQLLCHGGPIGSTFGLMLDADDRGAPPGVDADRLASLLAGYADMIRLVVVIACDSGNTGALGNQMGSVAQAIHRAGVAAVVASRYPISVKGAGDFVRVFYRELLVPPRSVEGAFVAARQRLSEVSTRLDWASVQLYAREDDGLDHRPFEIRPYRGLHAFTPEDRRFYFGREKEVERLLDGLRTGQRILTVVGASGSGKSSLVMAGLVPAVREGKLGAGTWQVRTLRPGAKPCDALSGALTKLVSGADSEWRRATLRDVQGDTRDDLVARPDALARIVQQRLGSASQLLLVVDQLEELVNLGEDRAEALAFTANLLHATSAPDSPVRVVFTLRADFLGRCLDFDRALAERLEPSIRIALPMDQAELKEVIVRPAALVGLRIDESVVGALLDALREGASTAANLPLLEFALEGLWERRRGGRIQQSAWEALGGLRGAVATRADEVLAACADDVERGIARNLFSRLVQLGEGAGDTRRYVTRAELESIAPRARQELDRWIAARLLTTDGDEVAVAHEAVIREWGTLRKWLAEDREALLVRQELGHGAKPWLAGGRSADDLWRGGRLKRATELRDAGRLRLSGDEVAFLEAAEAAQRAEIAKEEAAAAKARRWRLRALAAALSVAVAAIAGLAIMAGLRSVADQKTQEAIAQRAIAEQKTREKQMSSLLTAAHLLASKQPAPATKLLLEVVHMDASKAPDAWLPIALDVLDRGAPYFTFAGHRAGVQVAAWSPDAKRVATASDDWTVRVWNADGTGAPVVLRGHEAAVVDVAWSPDGKLLLTGSEDYTARIWNADGSGTPVSLRAHEGTVLHVAFSPDGQHLVTASADGTARVWRTDGARRSIELRGHKHEVRWAAWSRDGRRLVTASADKTARVWDTDRWDEPFWDKSVPFSDHKGGLRDAEFDPEGERVVTASDDGTARVWRADGKGKPIVLRGHQAGVYTASFSPDGRRIVTASVDMTARVWSADGEGTPRVLAGHQLYLRSASWSPDGRRILTAAWDLTARVWDADGGAPVVLESHTGYLMSAAWSPVLHDDRVVTASLDGTARIWKVPASDEGVTIFGQPAPAYTASWSPDGKRLVASVGDNTARLWNADGSGEPGVLQGHQSYVHFAGWSPDGARVVTASWDKTARVWDAEKHSLMFVLAPHDDIVNAAVYSPDGKHIVTVSDDRLVRLWDAAAAGAPHVLGRHDGKVLSAAFCRDGTRVATGSSDRTARIWDAGGSGEPRVLRGHAGPVNTVAWSPDCARIVTASDDGTARIWAADGSGKALVLSDPAGFTSAAFSPDGARVVTTSRDQRVRLWNAADGSPGPVFRGHGKPVSWAAWSPDGLRIASASEDNTVRLWDVALASTKASQTVSTLVARLEALNVDCLLAGLRQSYLDEKEGEAAAAHAACERDHGRPPLPPGSE